MLTIDETETLPSLMLSAAICEWQSMIPGIRNLPVASITMTPGEAAMFVPSGTMGNLVALMAHTGRGGEVLLEESSHILKSEMGGVPLAAKASASALFDSQIPQKMSISLLRRP